MIRIIIIGLGNVGHHLALACTNQKQIDLVQIISSQPAPTEFSDICFEKDIQQLKPADIYIIATPDDTIQSLDLNHIQGLVVHTSGTKSLDQINAKRQGVFYPLQSFSKDVIIDISTIPFCLETASKEDLTLLTEFTTLLSSKIYHIDEQQRKKLHLAAVFANNFTNHMIGLAQNICRDNHIDVELLNPLLAQTFEKLKQTTSKEAQTGPAVRNDTKTIQSHLNQLDDSKKEIYRILTDSIQQTHGSKL